MILAVPYNSFLILYGTRVYSPEQGVVCDKGRAQCFNNHGYSPEFTKEHFNESRIYTNSAVPTVVKFSNEVTCDFVKQDCQSELYGKDEYYETILFQNTVMSRISNQ
ncbi:YcgJ family protein [Plesiomonas shigelloides]|uniref:YcgJ family protein n=1 Tax=Plesiomonas shigelloides TaxID=703 RepID=UPI003BF5AE43